MRAIPAVDLREGRCVQLVGGRPEEERVSLPDPLEVALRWARLGFRGLHVVDLDAALGRGENRSLVARIAEATGAEVQVGGGIREGGTAARLLEIGAERVIVGTRAVTDPDWLEALARDHPGRVVVAADVRGGEGPMREVVIRGWTEGSGVPVEEFLERLDPLPLAGVLCTDVGREGRMEGIDREGMAEIVAASAHPIWVSGGVTTLDELAFLDEAGAAGAVLGMALYSGALDAESVAREYGS